MNLIVLSLSFLLCKCQVRFRHLRTGLAALCGAIICALFLLYAPGYLWAVAGMACAAVPVMLYIAFGWNGKKEFAWRLLVSWFSIVVVNGVAEALWNLTGIRVMTLYGAVLVLFAAQILVETAKTSVRRQSRLYAVTLYHGAQSVQCLGLYDTGNMLETEGGEPVHIVSPVLMEKLDIREEAGVQLIPFRALGVKEGWIRIFCVEKMQIEKGKKMRILSNVWLGKAEEELLKGKSYQMIINGAKGVIS